MRLKLTSELLSIFEKIIAEDKADAEWSEIESDDMFQSENYCGGYDATECAFCFSYFTQTKSEFWFQLTLDEIKNIVEGKIDEIQVRPAEK